MHLAGEDEEDDDEDQGTNDLTYTPRDADSKPPPSLKPPEIPRRHPKSAEWKCFATSGVADGHQDASALKKLGVWLGSKDKSDEVVTEFSFTELRKMYYRSTNGGKSGFDIVEPVTNPEHHRNPSRDLGCASCLHSGIQPQAGMVTKNLEFSHKGLRRMIWIYPCKLDGRDVFALLKTERFRHGANGIRSFWKAKGGYTNEVMVASGSKETLVARANNRAWHIANELSDRLAKYVDAQEDDSEPDSTGAYGKHVSMVKTYADGLEDSDERHLQSDDAGTQPESAFAPPAMCDEDEPKTKLQLEQSASSSTAYKRAHSVDEDVHPPSKRQRTHSGSDQPGPMATSPWPDTGAGRNDSDVEDLYNVTPGIEDSDAGALLSTDFQSKGTCNISSLEQSTDTSALLGRSETHSRAPNGISLTPSLVADTFSHGLGASSATGRSYPPTTANTTPSPLAKILKVWFKVCQADGRRIVSLSTAMTIQEVFAAIQLAFSDEMTGGNVTKLTFTLPRDVFDETIVIARHDEPTWLALLEMAGGSSSLPVLRGEVFT